jgi:4-amino-4-deoxy-L-arabinose transferase-like glycosyltransferase
MSAKPFDSTMQDLVYNMDVGIGLQVIKKILYFLFIAILLVLYPSMQFQGLTHPEAMEYAQLGRNLMTQGQFVTQCIRPSTLWYLSRSVSDAKHPAPPASLADRQPDVLHPPLYPVILAGVFKASGTTFTLGRGSFVFPAEKLIAAVNILFTTLTGLMVFLLGRRLFDRRLAVLALTVYFLSDKVLDMSISGLGIPLATFLCIAACYLAVVAASNRQENAPTGRWLFPLVLSAVCCVLAFLTRYGTAVIVPVLALFIGLSFPQKKWSWAGGFLLIFLLGISPWLVRNAVVSGGSILGMAHYTALNNTNLFEENMLERTLHPHFGGLGRVLNALQAKWLVTTARAYNENLRTIGDGLWICLFLVMFLHRFVRPTVHRLRWCMALGIVGLVLIGGFFGDATLQLLFIFWPFIILYGLAFFLVMLERLQFGIRLFNLATTTAIVFLSALPLIFTLLPPRAGIPYPPYHPPFVSLVSNMLNENELMCTDMPWATAWYGNRTSLLLPSTLQEFYEINDYTRKISALYFTTLTRDKPYARTLLTGSYKTWFPILEGKIPSDFPLSQGFSLPPNTADQLFLTDRQRWKDQ